MRMRILLIVGLAMGFAGNVWAQTALNQVRLTEPVTTVGQTAISLSVADSVSVGDVLYVDREAMVATAVNTTTDVVTAGRGQLGTRADFHPDDAIVYTGTAVMFYYTTPSGRCTTTSAYPGGRRPWINILTGQMAYCDDNVFGVNSPSYWRLTGIQPDGGTGRLPYTAIAYRTSRTSAATVITPAYSALITDVLIASLTYSGPFEVFLHAPTGMLGKKIIISDFARLGNTAGGPQGRTLTIRGLFENGDNSVILGRYADPSFGGASDETPLFVGIGATTSFYVGITASSMYYWMAGSW